jgi:hypothetical protein
MSQRTYPVGTSQVPLILTIDREGPVSGLVVTARIIVPWTNYAFDFSDNTFKPFGSVVTPTVTLTEWGSYPAIYFYLWNSTSIVTDSDVIVIYESVGSAPFIYDDPISFQTAGAGTTTIINGFSQAVFDQTNRTLTIVAGVKNAVSGLLPATSATFTVKDELGRIQFSGTSTSTTGLHRKIFPNVNLVPNRIYLVDAVFVVGASSFNVIEPITTLGSAV